MRTIKVEALTREAFAPFGQYYTMTSPDGYPLTGELHRFFPDRLVASQGTNVAYSPLLVKKPTAMHVTQVEYHTTTAELILPL
ncbi:MAG: Ureidoglycolate hydrolase, partial [Clostridia bacterium]|nr:Ureidoglycolate hydrolase [Clostridia bacterium]